MRRSSPSLKKITRISYSRRADARRRVEQNCRLELATFTTESLLSVHIKSTLDTLATFSDGDTLHL